MLYVLTSWVNTATGYWPRVTRDHVLNHWEDVTSRSIGTPPAPNLVVVRVNGEASVLAAIRTDPNAHVLHDDADAAGEQPALARTNLRAWLLLHGVPAGDVNDSTAGRTRRDVARSLRTWLRQRPRV